VRKRYRRRKRERERKRESQGKSVVSGVCYEIPWRVQKLKIMQIEVQYAKCNKRQTRQGGCDKKKGSKEREETLRL